MRGFKERVPVVPMIRTPFTPTDWRCTLNLWTPSLSITTFPFASFLSGVRVGTMLCAIYYKKKVLKIHIYKERYGNVLKRNLSCSFLFNICMPFVYLQRQEKESKLARFEASAGVRLHASFCRATEKPFLSLFLSARIGRSSSY